MEMGMKGNAIVSSVIISSIVIASVVVSVQVLYPKIREMQSSTYFDEALNVMSGLYSSAHDVYMQSQGARKAFEFYLPYGEMYINGNNIIYKMYSYSHLVDNNVQKKFGNVVVSGGYPINSYNDSDSFYIDNGNILVSFKRTNGNINASDLINYISIDGEKIYPKISVDIDHDPATSVGTGYTEILPVGNGEKYLAHVSNSKFNYTVSFMIMPGWDYMKIKIENLEEN